VQRLVFQLLLVTVGCGRDTLYPSPHSDFWIVVGQEIQGKRIGVCDCLCRGGHKPKLAFVVVVFDQLDSVVVRGGMVDERVY
jgi:hypothetical protein